MGLGHLVAVADRLYWHLHCVKALHRSGGKQTFASDILSNDSVVLYGRFLFSLYTVLMPAIFMLLAKKVSTRSHLTRI